MSNKLNKMQNQPKMQIKFGFYYLNMHLKIMKNMKNMGFIIPPTLIFCSSRAKPKWKQIQLNILPLKRSKQVGFHVVNVYNIYIYIYMCVCVCGYKRIMHHLKIIAIILCKALFLSQVYVFSLLLSPVCVKIANHS